MSPERRKIQMEGRQNHNLQQQYEETLAIFPPGIHSEKEGLISDAFNELSGRLAQHEGFVFGNNEQEILKLKLARYFQRENNIDTNTLFDAIIETPGFITTEKGGLHRLLKIHEEKTLQRIAEMRVQRAAMTGQEKFNPYEGLFETNSGKFYLARLLNMPHLKEESAYMRHCVGTSDSYINKIKRGEVEIFSLRTKSPLNKDTGKPEGDVPVLTIEYDPKSKKIMQMKKANDAFITNVDISKFDLFGMIEQIRATTTDAGESRDFSHISPGELVNIKVPGYHVLTQKGPVHYKDFDPDEHVDALKYGKMPLEGLSKTEVVKIVRILSGIQITERELAQKETEVTNETRMYIGPLYPNFFHIIPDTVEHIYTSFPESKIRRDDVMIGGRSAEQLITDLENTEIGNEKMHVSDFVKAMMRKKTTDDEYGVFETQTKSEKIVLVRLTVPDLGFPNGATTKQIFDKLEEYGLELCPAEVGPCYRQKYTDQPMGEHLYIGMKQISDPDGLPDVFDLLRGGGGVWLEFSWAGPGAHWSPDNQFIFRLRK